MTVVNQQETPRILRGYDRLKDPELNKGTAYSREERELFGLRGLLPARVSTIESQQSRVLENLRRKDSDIERYIFLLSLQGRNEQLFYRLLIDHIEELMPLVYTPTVGQACQEFAHIFRQPRGFYITPGDRGSIRRILDNWPERDVRMIIVTDGERILGLGDLGANGMGIPIGKLALYSACAGIRPRQCMPVMLDVGTNNVALRNDPLYLGTNQPRMTGDDYHALVDEFVVAVQDAFPHAVIQFEDFIATNAFTLLDRYRDRLACFNDDIQGTAAVTLAGVLASGRITGIDFTDLRILFLGAGSAATGIADLLRVAFRQAGLGDEEARQRLWFVDRPGLVVRGWERLSPHIRAYAHDVPAVSLAGAIGKIRPQVLVGATGCPGAFTEEVIRQMAQLNSRPVIFALSNPTSQSECTARQAYEWSDGRALFASGSPFAAVAYNDRVFRPGQSNNAYVFPGVGLGAIACRARIITDEMFLAAARTLADMVGDEALAAGMLYPPLTDIRRVSLAIAAAVAEMAWQQGVAQAEKPADVEDMIAQQMYEPGYRLQEYS
jgi:malate dehydrogenase (oxaloacetate-decarboxylating)(NADP+)